MSSTSPAGAPDVDRLRLSVLGADGATSHLTVDAAVSPIRLLEALAVGPATLRRLAGDPLRPDLPLAEQEVPSGACLVLEPLHRTGAPDRDPEPGPRPAAAAGGWRVGAALGAVGCFVLAALVVALEVVARIRGDATASGGSTDGEPVLSTDARAVGIAALLLAVLVATGAIRAGRGSAALAPVRVALPPLAGAGVAFASAEAGPGLLLALTAAAVTVAAVAAFLRADRRVGRGSMAETALFVEAVLGALTAAATGTALLTDVPLHACAALVAGAALPVLRLLPAAILRVPERLLLDVDTVAVTAWSPADEVPVGAGDGSVSTRAVGARIRRDRRLLDAAVVGAVGTAVACLAVALPETLDGAPAVLEEEIAAIALAVAVAVGLEVGGQAS